MARPAIVALVLALTVVALSACGAAHPADPTAGRRIVHVVAAENVWGDIARQIGGRHVAVRSILSDPGADPHLYESTPRDAVAVQTANLVIVNGAGYDDFMSKLLGASSGKGRAELTVADELHVKGSNPNPHLWYDVARAPDVAAAIERALARADPRDAATFAANRSRFDASLRPLANTLGEIERRYPGAPVAYTERVPRDLLADAGLTVKTPPGFAQAVEDGNEPSPADRAAMDDLISGHEIRALLYNAQATSLVTKSARSLAHESGVPVVEVTETLPPGETYQSWQLRQARALLAALGQTPTPPAR